MAKKNPQNMDELKAAILEACDEIPLQFIKNAIAAVPGRLAKIAESGGERII